MLSLLLIFSDPTHISEQNFFKKSQYPQAIEKYSIAASVAVQRPAWEAQQLMRDDLSAVLSNRSAAACEAGDYISALVDAEQVILLKRNWTKGHFRKGKALVGLGRFQEARDAVELGLAFEPTNTVRMVLFKSRVVY
jgi:translocation protein SEC72